MGGPYLWGSGKVLERLGVHLGHGLGVNVLQLGRLHHGDVLHPKPRKGDKLIRKACTKVMKERVILLRPQLTRQWSDTEVASYRDRVGVCQGEAAAHKELLGSLVLQMSIKEKTSRGRQYPPSLCIYV